MRRIDCGWLVAAAATAALINGTPAEAACSISATGVAFGTYDPRAAGADDGTGSLSISCNPTDTSLNIALGAGTSGSFSPRKMASGATRLNYNLYTSSSRTVVWGDGSGGTSSVTLNNGLVSGGVRRFSATVFGRVPALQNVPAGTYLDTIIVTVTF